MGYLGKLDPVSERKPDCACIARRFLTRPPVRMP
jgi:hypothetical protein